MDRMKDQLKRSMNTRTYVLVGLLVATLVWIQSLDERQRALRARARAAGARAPGPAVAAAQAVKHGPSTPTDSGWGRDPFAHRFGTAPGGSTARPAQRGGPSSAQTGLYLQGVMSGPAGRTALINGEVYQEGERIGSREVLQIGSRSVLLLDQGTVITLTLKGDGS